MSSTTDRSPQRGQILVLFAGGLVALFLVAALAFDVGMMLLERRDQQNAADAAALAGARYVLTSANYSNTCAAAAGNAAAQAACQLALANEFGDDANGNETVTVYIPPIHGTYAGLPGFVEVQIQSTRASIFAGVMGRGAWPVGVYAVAANQQGITFPFGMLALSPTECKAIQIAGSGVVNSAGNIHSNSNGTDCLGDPIGFSRSGSGTLNVSADNAVCGSASEIQDQGSGTMTCTPLENTFSLPDPLRSLPAPTRPLAAATPPLVPVGHAPTPAQWPDWCPGTTSSGKPFNETKNKPCEVSKAWIFSPGLYPGGISVKGSDAVAYLLPGIYWIGGGGFSTSNGGSVISVAAGATETTLSACHANRAACVAEGGIMLYNSRLATAASGPISLGGGGATLKLLPYDYPFGDGTIDLVIFQDRTVCQNVELNGSSASASYVRGIVYVPCGEVVVNGSSSVFTMDQVIADTFKINGSGGTVNVLRETGVDAEISGVGLVE